MARGSTIQANSVRKVVDMARQTGVDVAALLARYDIAEDQLAVPGARVAFATFVALYEDAARASGDEAFGLRVGASTDPGMFDVLGQVVLSCATLREAFATVARYLRVLQEGAVITLDEHNTLARARYAIIDPDVGPHRHEVEATLAIMVRFIDTAVGKLRPSHVWFTHPAPRDPSHHEHVFRARVEFGRPSNELGFARELLDCPMPRADESLRAILERHIVEMLAKLPAREGLVEDVRGTIARMLERGEPQIDKVARGVAMSGRTLQRRLREHGTSFAEILDDVRKDLAVLYLADARHEIAEAAFLLGYADLSTFHRAFRRWMGVSPGEWRRRA